MKKTLLSLALIALTGCVGSMVPKTHISGTVLGQPYSFDCPKDVDINGFEIAAETNKVTVKIQSLKTRMNPEVITTTADGQAKLISTSVAAGAAIAGQAAAAAAGKP